MTTESNPAQKAEAQTVGISFDWCEEVNRPSFMYAVVHVEDMSRIRTKDDALRFRALCNTIEGIQGLPLILASRIEADGVSFQWATATEKAVAERLLQRRWDTFVWVPHQISVQV